MKVVIVLLVIIAVIILFVLTNIRIVPQSKAFVIERLGAYYATWDTGLHVKIPFIDRVAKNVSLKEQVVDFKPQPVITKDNVTMQIDTVVFSKSQTLSFIATVLKALSRLSKIFPQPLFVTLSVSLSLTRLLPHVTQSMPKSELFLMRLQTRGALR